MEWSAERVRQATERFMRGLEGADPAAEVPACPGWRVLDLVAHLGNVHTWAGRIVETGRAAETPTDVPDPERMAGWYAERAERLVGILTDADPDTPCWNFAGVEETRAFWPRRQYLEVTMHLVDLDQAYGRVTALDPGDCAAGVDETLTVFLPRLHARGFPADLAVPVSLVATDTDRTWTLTPRQETFPDVARGPAAPADIRLEGTAEALWLLLWKRADEGVARIGDRDVLRRLLASRLSA